MRSTRGVSDKRLKPRRGGRRWLRMPSPRAWRALALIACIAAPASAAVYLWRDGLPTPLHAKLYVGEGAALDFTARLGLSVQDIYVEGRTETPAADVLAVLEVSRNAPILAFEPNQARLALERLPWVKNASVERRLPGTVYVRLTEREPLALWQRHGKLALIDVDGVEIPNADLDKFAALPVVVGDDAPQHARAFIDMVAAEPDLAARIAAAVRVSARRWNVNLDMGDGRTIEIQLPEINAAASWTQLAELAHANGLLERNITAVDLRLADRLVVRVIQPPPPPAKKPAAPAKKPA